MLKTMVQLPELCVEKSEAYKAAGYKDICEIGKERIRRAGKKILENRESTKQNETRTAKGQAPLLTALKTDGFPTNSHSSTLNSPLDIGFKVFKLSSSNLQVWN